MPTERNEAMSDDNTMPPYGDFAPELYLWSVTHRIGEVTVTIDPVIAENETDAHHVSYRMIFSWGVKLGIDPDDTIIVRSTKDWDYFSP
jgi:hypothetical protein